MHAQPPGGVRPCQDPTVSLADQTAAMLRHWQFELRMLAILEEHRRAARPLCLLWLELNPLQDMDRDQIAQLLDRLTQSLNDPVIEKNKAVFPPWRRSCLVLPGATPARGILLAQSLLQKLDQLAPPAGAAGSVLSMGLASFPQDADDALDLLRRSELALYHAKWSGGGRLSHRGQGRRSPTRLPLRMHLALRPLLGEPGLGVLTTDISLGGCAIVTSRSLAPGRAVRLDLPGRGKSRGLAVAGSCVWSVPGQSGVAFDLGSDRELEKLRRLIREHTPGSE